jgi:branched-chain amino acid transport system permease protein
VLPETLKTIATLAVDGISFGMILFLISSGLTVTLGLMRVVNMAHGAFAMIGGYLALAGVRHLGVGLFPAALLAIAGTVAVAVVLERTVYRWVYRATELGQVLMTIGLTFVIISVITLVFDTSLHTLPVPALLAGNFDLGGVLVSGYRSFLVIVSCLIALAVWYVVERTDFGARLRAAVDNPTMARSVGINVQRVFAVAFAAGCGLAAVGGVLGTQMMALEPFYPLKYLVPMLTVVAVGGLGSLKGSFIAALLLGLGDTFGRYLLEYGGGLVIYVLVVLFLVVRPNGLFARA